MGASLVNFDLNEDRQNIIKVVGVGGGGGNAVKYMAKKGIKDVDFVICNTDAQVINDKDIDDVTYVQLGAALTGGYGAGNDFEKGKKAAEESIDDITAMLDENTKMVFITATLGGGTGTGASPVIAQKARELGILVVGVVTIPARFEGPKRLSNARHGLEELEKVVDSIIVIDSERLLRIHKDMRMSDAFAKANDVLLTAAKGIAEIITLPGYINVDFADVRTVMMDSGVAIMGAASANGENRALEAIRNALESPLLSCNILGAKNILFNITSGCEEIRTDELKLITGYIVDKFGENASVIWGVGEDMLLEDHISITVIATGFHDDIFTSGNPDLMSENMMDNVPIRLDYVELREDLSAYEIENLIKEPAYKRRSELRITRK